MIAGWNSDLSKVVAQFRDEIVRDQAHPLRRAAIVGGGLPVYCDMGGCLVITPEGEIQGYRGAEDTVQPVTDPKWRRLALVAAASKYSPLSALRPPRPTESQVCPVCGGDGKAEDDQSAWCGCCWGMGWIVPNGNDSAP